MDIQLIFEEFNTKMKNEFIKRKVTYIIGSVGNDIMMNKAIEYVKEIYGSTEFNIIEYDGESIDFSKIYGSKNITIMLIYDKYPKYNKLAYDNIIVTSLTSVNKTIEQIYNIIASNNNRRTIKDVSEIITLPIDHDNIKSFFIL